MPPPRVAVLAEDELTPRPACAARTRSAPGPRGGSITIRGPFAVFLHAPAFGELAQQLGGYCRYQDGGAAAALGIRHPGHGQAVARPVRMVRARAAGRARRASRKRRSATCTRDACRNRSPKDERAIYDFIQELYKTRRVSDKNFKRVVAVLGEPATVEFVGILGYYVLISMILNVFRMSPPEGEPLPFAEKP